MGRPYEDCDFSGWATVYDVKCADGRTLKKGSFAHCDGMKVPLVYNHIHDDPNAVLGHAFLESRDGGVYAYGYFNNTPGGVVTKEELHHGDYDSLSIWANELKQKGGDVFHGTIKELSLVLAGANPGAHIVDVNLAHGEEGDSEAVIFNEESIDLTHSIDFNNDDNNDDDTDEGDVVSHSGTKEGTTVADNKERTVQDVLNEMNDEQKKVVNFLLEEAAKGSTNKSEGGNDEMGHNVFDNTKQDDQLQHDGLNTIFNEAKRSGIHLRDAFISHAADYGIDGIELLQPDDHELYNVPQFVKNEPSAWVDVVMNAVHKTPFAKIRMTFADITEDEARAKGYVKGKFKKEEVFKLLRRKIGPTTIYKKQKFDRDDLEDADFDVVPWVKQEMQLMLKEEQARAYIFGDGRSAIDEDKIKEDCIIPVIADDDFYTIKYEVNVAQGEALEHALINACVLAQDDYRGSGNLIAFLDHKQVSRMLLMEDQFGHRLYKNDAELAGAMMVNRIVRVPSNIIPNGFYGVLVDLSDYNVGQKNNGQTGFFDDFDIDFNQYKYLIETRQSGALTKPFSAIALKVAA